MDHPALPFLKRDEKGKVVSAADAVQLIRDGQERGLNHLAHDRHGRAQYLRRRRHRPGHRARLPAFASENLATLIWANETLRLQHMRQKSGLRANA